MTVRAATETGMPKVIANAKKLGVGDFPNYLSIALGAGDTTVAKLVNSYAILANHGRSVKQSLIDYVQNREGKVIFRNDNRCQLMENCNAAGLGRQGDAAPAQPDQAIARSRWPRSRWSTCSKAWSSAAPRPYLRDLDRPMFGKTGTTSGPTNVWFVGGTPDVVAGVYMGYDQPVSMGGYAQGGRIAAPIFKQWAKIALASHPKTPFVAPAGIRWVRVDRGTGKRVYGVFPTAEDAKSSVIWEAFQPQTEPSRSFAAAPAVPMASKASSAAATAAGSQASRAPRRASADRPAAGTAARAAARALANSEHRSISAVPIFERF